MRSAIQYLVYVACRVLLALLALLPFEFVCTVARWIARLLYVAMATRRRIALENIERAFGNTLSAPEQKRLARASFESTTVSLVELLQVSKVIPSARQRVRVEGTEHLDQAFARGRGVVAAISHLGSWEYMAFMPYLTEHQWSVIMRPAHNPYLDKLVNQTRIALKLNPILKTGSIKPVLRELKQNHGVAILVDQWAGRAGIWTDFFGRPTSTTSVPARLSAVTGATIMTAFCLRQGNGRYLIRILPGLIADRDQPNWEHDTTATLNKIIEDQIRLQPDQWTWGHRRWRDGAPTLQTAEVSPAQTS